ncbi:SNO glutamine amidotransferase [Ramicandelaber brevisporus]|nr:SNO glutamine amidotransferase [Ramicandelaber brevisporus]
MSPPALSASLPAPAAAIALPTVRIGVLALQGAFIEHIVALRSLRPAAFSVEPVEVRTAEQLAAVDALVIPGGESTAISIVAERTGLVEPLRAFVRTKPTWGTCAGLILIADEASGTKEGGQTLLGGLHVRVQRNQFGRQVDSFVQQLAFPPLPAVHLAAPFAAVFIRAPTITAILAADSVEILSELDPLADGTRRIVAVRQGHLLGTSFHPELTSDNRWHLYFACLAAQIQAKQHQL